MEQDNKTLEQRRSTHAWKSVKLAKKTLNENDRTDFSRQVKRMPVGIMTSGLGHTIAFMHASEKKLVVREMITDRLADWLLKERGFKVNVDNPKGKDIEEEIRRGNSDFLRLVTEECMLYLQWLMRYADAEFKSKK